MDRRSRLCAAFSFLLCAAAVCSMFAACGRTRQVSPRVTPTTTETDETTTDEITDDAETDDVERDADHVVVIDPGHGFGDAGLASPYTESSEAEIALDFSKKLYDELYERGYTVFLTHDGSSIPETKVDNKDGAYDERERAAFADESEAEYFISIHCNTYAQDGAEDVTGSRVYVSSAAKAGISAVRLAGEALCAALNETPLGEDQYSLIVTPEHDSYKITTLADGVSLLLKLGYMSNESDARLMTDEAWLSETAKRTADAIDAYFSEE